MSMNEAGMLQARSQTMGFYGRMMMVVAVTVLVLGKYIRLEITIGYENDQYFHESDVSVC